MHRPRHTGGLARLLGRARLKSRRTSSSLVFARNHLHRNRGIVPSLCVCAYVCVRAYVRASMCARAPFIHPRRRVRTRARERVHPHTCDNGGDSRGQARRRRRLARSNPTTATTTVNEIVGSVSANYHAVPGVRGASLRSYPPSCIVTRKGVASGREKSAITPDPKVAHRSGFRNRSNPGEFDS